jgi:hypothetical protein
LSSFLFTRRIRHENQVASLGFSRAEQSARDAAGTAAFCGNNVPISGEEREATSIPPEETLFPMKGKDHSTKETTKHRTGF